MDINELGSVGATFTENKRYMICRYGEEDKKLYYQMLDEVYRDSTISYVESIKDMQWKMILNNGNMGGFKVIQKDIGNLICNGGKVCILIF